LHVSNRDAGKRGDFGAGWILVGSLYGLAMPL
jgi:hypothetical protein